MVGLTVLFGVIEMLLVLALMVFLCCPSLLSGIILWTLADGIYRLPTGKASPGLTAW